MPPGAITYGQPVNWAHPLNRGRVMWLYGVPPFSGTNRWFDLCGRYPGTLTNGPTWGGGPNGLAELSFVSASSQSVNCGTPDGLNGAAQAAYACWISKSSNAVTAGLGGSAGYTAGGNRFSTLWFTDGLMYIVAESATAAYGFAAVPVGRRRLMVAYDGGGAGNSTRLRAWIDGSPLAMSYSGTIPAALGVVGPWTLGKDSSNRFCGGKIGDTSLWLGRGFSNADAAADYDQASRGYPEALNRLRPWSFGVSSSANVTVALTGSSVTTAPGTLSPNNAIPLSGSALTISSGTTTPTTSLAITGSALLSSTGTLVPTTVVPLVGSEQTTATGTLTPTTGITIELTGQSMSVSTGTLSPVASIPLTGSASTTSAGTLTPVIGITIELTGLSMTTALGTILPSSAIPLTGSTLVVSTGTLSPATSVPLSGSSIAIATGTVVPDTGLQIQLTGVSMGMSVGTLSPGLEVALAGLDLTWYAGTLTPVTPPPVVYPTYTVFWNGTRFPPREFRGSRLKVNNWRGTTHG